MTWLRRIKSVGRACLHAGNVAASWQADLLRNLIGLFQNTQEIEEIKRCKTKKFERNLWYCTEKENWSWCFQCAKSRDIDGGAGGSGGNADTCYYLACRVKKSDCNLEDCYTDPDMAKDFVNRTGVDALAIAFGTAHGIYVTKPILNLERIKKIKEKIDIPFVMHGVPVFLRKNFEQRSEMVYARSIITPIWRWRVPGKWTVCWIKQKKRTASFT